MTAVSKGEVKPSVKRHRRETLLQIVLPVLAGAVLIIVLLVTAALLQARQMGAIADFLLTVMVLCPAAICMLPFYMIFAVLALSFGGVHSAAAKPLRRVEDLTSTLSSRTRAISDSISRRSIDLSVKIAPLERLLMIFERNDLSVPEGKDDGKEQ